MHAAAQLAGRHAGPQRRRPLSDVPLLPGGGAAAGAGLAERVCALARRQEGQDAPAVAEAAREAVARAGTLGVRRLARLAWAFATLRPRDPALVAALSEAALAAAAGRANLAPRDLSSLTWSLVKMHAHNPQFAHAAAAQALTRLSAFAPLDLCGFTWALAALGPKGASPLVQMFFRSIASVAPEKVQSFGPQGLSNLAWSFAAVLMSEKPLFQSIAADVVRRVGEFAPQALSTLLWSFAMLRIAAPRLFQAASVEAAGKLNGFSPQGLSNLVWSLAKCRDLVDCPGKVLSLIARAAQRGARRGSLRPQDVSNFAWAFAPLATADSDYVLSALADQAMRTLNDFAPNHVAGVAWALAPRAVECPELFQEMSHRIVAEPTRFEAQGLSNLAWAFAKLDLGHPKCFEALGDEASKQPNSFLPQGLANVTWAFATVPLNHPGFLRAVAREVVPHVNTLEPRDLCNLAWSFAVLECSELCVLRAVSAEMSSQLRSFDPRREPRQELPKLATSVLGIVWALNFAAVPNEALLDIARPRILELGRILGSAGAPCPVPLPPAGLPAKARGSLAAGTRTAERGAPVVALDLGDRLAIVKPPGWEVDQGQVRELPTSARPLSRFLRALLGGPRGGPSDLARDAAHDFGLLHRLDAPSSGLVLAAKTHEAYYDLLLQLSAGTLQREYVVLCHGFMPPDRREVRASVRWGPDSRTATEVARRGGRRSRTRFKVLAHAWLKGEAFSLVGVSIATGRRHQIRAHMACLGHPAVCDGKYAPARFPADHQWCPRNFLHRFRLGFRDAAGASREALAPLPPDLARPLARLSPKGRASEKELRRWLRGGRLLAWEDMEALTSQ